MKDVKTYTIFPSLHSDIANCTAWLQPEIKIKPRSAIMILNNNNDKKIFCEYYKIDKNFIQQYSHENYKNILESNKPVMFINHWYRYKLGMNATGEKYNLTIKSTIPVFGKLMVNIGHPQSIVRIATWLGLWSVLLGLISIIQSTLYRIL